MGKMLISEKGEFELSTFALQEYSARKYGCSWSYKYLEDTEEVVKCPINEVDLFYFSASDYGDDPIPFNKTFVYYKECFNDNDMLRFDPLMHELFEIYGDKISSENAGIKLRCYDSEKFYPRITYNMFGCERLALDPYFERSKLEAMGASEELIKYIEDHDILVE